MVKDFEILWSNADRQDSLSPLFDRKNAQFERINNRLESQGYSSVRHTLKAAEILNALPSRQEELKSILDESKAIEQERLSTIREGIAKLSTMDHIPSVAKTRDSFQEQLNRYEETRKSRESRGIRTQEQIPTQVEVTPAPATEEALTETLEEIEIVNTEQIQEDTAPQVEIDEKIEPENITSTIEINSSSARTRYETEIEGINFSTTRYKEHELLQAIKSGITDKRELAKLIYGEISRSSLNNIAATVTRLNQSLNQFGIYLMNSGNLGSASYEFKKIESKNDEIKSTLEQIPETTASNASETIIIEATRSTEKRIYRKTANKEKYIPRDVALSEEITIKNVGGISASIIEAIQKGITDESAIVKEVWGKSDPDGLAKLRTLMAQGLKRTLGMHGFEIKNLTSKTQIEEGMPSNFRIIKINTNIPETTHTQTSTEILEESTQTTGFTNYEAALISTFLTNKANISIAEKFDTLKIPFLEDNIYDAIMNLYVIGSHPENAPKNGELNEVRKNILNKLTKVFEDGSEIEYFDLSSVGGGHLLNYFARLNPEQRSQVISILTEKFEKLTQIRGVAYANGVIDLDSVETTLVDYGPAGREATPEDSIPAKIERRPRADTTAESTAPSVILKKGADKPDWRPETSVDQAARPGMSRIEQFHARLVRGAAIKGTDHPKDRVIAIEASEVSGQVLEEAQIPAEYRDLLKVEKNALEIITSTIEDALIKFPELTSDPFGSISFDSLTRNYSSLTAKLLNKYLEKGIISVQSINDKRKFLLPSIIKAIVYKQLDSNGLNQRANRQLDNAVSKFVNQKIEEIMKTKKTSTAAK